MGFQLSPGVQVKEIDLSTSIPAVATSLGATVGRFTWGPAFERYLITSETDLVTIFGRPTNDTYPAFLSAAAFLKFGNSLQTVRIVDDTAMNATTGSEVVRIDNTEDFDTKHESGTLAQSFYGRYPGYYGNTLSVETTDGADWDNWSYRQAFEAPPDTNNDEMAVAVLRHDAVCSDPLLTPHGEAECISAGKGWMVKNPPEIIETFLVSAVEGAIDPATGNNIFAEEVINKRSKFIWVVAGNVVNTGDVSHAFAGGHATSHGVDAYCTVADPAHVDLATCEAGGGIWWPEVAPGAIGANEYMMGWDMFTVADEVDITLAIAGGVQNESSEICTLVEKYMIEEVSEFRKDNVSFVGPPRSVVVNVGGASPAVAAVIAWRKDVSFNVNSSYGFIDGQFKQTYDKYNDTYRWVGMSGDCAGLAANTDNVRDAWWSIAGLNRGQIRGVVKLAYQPKLAHRDQLYMIPNCINPIVTFPGQGTVLWGDRTATTKPSAFDRINVRRLFIIMEKAISISAKYFLFEFNNKYTRANFRNMVNPYLAGLQARQAMYDFYVQCDETNNTGEVIDANEFVASIFIKPSKSINFITLNFVATKTGVDFSEVIGQV